MTLPPLLRSKFFWTFTVGSSTLAALIYSDRIKAAQLRESYLREAILHGKQPLLDHQQPRKLALLLCAKDADEQSAIKKVFKEYAVDFLTAAGVDYAWCIDIEPGRIKKLWNAACERQNEPEAMIEEPKDDKTVNTTITPESIREKIVKPMVKYWVKVVNSGNRHIEDGLDGEKYWNILLSQDLHVHPIISDFLTDGLVPVNPETFEITLTALKEYNNQVPDQSTIPNEIASPWYSRLFSKRPKNILNLEPTTATIGLLNCSYPQNLTARFRRFFDRAGITREVGEATMKIIRDQRKPVFLNEDQNQVVANEYQ